MHCGAEHALASQVDARLSPGRAYRAAMVGIVGGAPRVSCLSFPNAIERALSRGDAHASTRR